MRVFFCRFLEMSIELSRLQDAACRSPREKLGVFVRVHKLIVGRHPSLSSHPCVCFCSRLTAYHSLQMDLVHYHLFP